MKGIKRFRQAIKNQRNAGEGEFRLSFADADEIAAEIEDELSRLSWAQGVPAPVDADGEVVPLTTEVLYNGTGRELRVRDIQFTREGAYKWTAYCFPQGHGVADLFLVNCTYLHCPDSWERLEKDAKLAPRDYLQGRGMDPDKTDRIKTITTDIVRRAKALAERDAKGAERG